MSNETEDPIHRLEALAARLATIAVQQRLLYDAIEARLEKAGVPTAELLAVSDKTFDVQLYAADIAHLLRIAFPGPRAEAPTEPPTKPITFH